MSIITTPDMCVIATIDICVARTNIIVRTAVRGLRFYLYPKVGAASGGMEPRRSSDFSSEAA